MASYRWCTVKDVQDYMTEEMWRGFTHDVADGTDFTEKLIERASAEIIGYIKDVVEPAIWQAWTSATAPDEIREAAWILTVCRHLPRRDSPMAPGTQTQMERECVRIREWLMMIKDGDLELSVDMVADEPEGWQASVFGKDREAVF